MNVLNLEQGKSSLIHFRVFFVESVLLLMDFVYLLQVKSISPQASWSPTLALHRALEDIYSCAFQSHKSLIKLDLTGY